jgi:hypothetical protein
MQIFDLPKKAGLAHLDAQYFHNEPKPGKAEHVIKIQYRTKRGDPQKFVIPVTADTRNINRSAKRVLGEADGLLIKKMSKQLNKDGVLHYFGFRQVCFTEGKKNGQVHFKKKSDGNTQCWVIPRAEGYFEVQLMWAGEPMVIKVYPHKNEVTKEGQSQGIGYFNAQEELITFMEKKHVKNVAAIINDANLNYEQSGEESLVGTEQANSGGDCSGQSFEGRTETAEDRETGEEYFEVHSGNQGSNRLGADELIASIAGHAEADRLRASYSSQMVDEDGYELPPEERGIENRYAKSVGRDTKSFKQRAKQYMVDNNQWGDWAPEKVHPAANGIGITFSVFRNV